MRTARDWEQWLADRESAVSGLKPGTEAGIVWADPGRKTRSPLALVYLPGYTATRGEIQPVVERVAAGLGANVYYSRPAGHGMGPDGHKDVKVEDWHDDGRLALEIGSALGERVVLIGVSTGGTLATWLILGPVQAQVAASVLIAPNFATKNRLTELLLWPGKRGVLKLLAGDYIRDPALNERHARIWDYEHHAQSLIPMMRLVQQARSGRFERWPSPVLFTYDPQDSVVSSAVTARLAARVPAAQRTVELWTTAEGDHNHVIAGDALSPGGTERLTDLVGAYLRRVLAP